MSNERPLMTQPPVAAHLILGARPEPFLSAMLESIASAATTLIVNDNAPEPSPHTAILQNSPFGRESRIEVDRTPFRGFAAARNICLRIHERVAGGQWVAFVDADEVHGPQIARIAERLSQLPKNFDFVDGYTWHFFQSFNYYTSIERRMAFFRFAPDARWEGLVHERLLGINGRRLALPYVYGHYGHTLQPRRHAEKGRQYSSLGAAGAVLSQDQLADFDVERYFAPEYPRLLHFGGRHPPAARSTLAQLAPSLAESHERTERMARAQSWPIEVRNVLRKLNYELRWRGRAFDSSARRMLIQTAASCPQQPG